VAAPGPPSLAPVPATMGLAPMSAVTALSACAASSDSARAGREAGMQLHIALLRRAHGLRSRAVAPAAAACPARPRRRPDPGATTTRIRVASPDPSYSSRRLPPELCKRPFLRILACGAPACAGLAELRRPSPTAGGARRRGGGAVAEVSVEPTTSVSAWPSPAAPSGDTPADGPTCWPPWSLLLVVAVLPVRQRAATPDIRCRCTSNAPATPSSRAATARNGAACAVKDNRAE
jgi:hypothetical protein